MSIEVLECDFLVVGAGMAGLSAAGWAAERGARVIVVEKAPAIGGSDRKSTRLNSSHIQKSRMPSSA